MRGRWAGGAVVVVGGASVGMLWIFSLTARSCGCLAWSTGGNASLMRLCPERVVGVDLGVEVSFPASRLPGGTFLAAVGHRICTLPLGHERHFGKLETLGVSATKYKFEACQMKSPGEECWMKGNSRWDVMTDYRPAKVTVMSISCTVCYGDAPVIPKPQHSNELPPATNWLQDAVA